MDQQTQQPDLFTQRRFELMIDMATKKLQHEITALKEHVSSLNSEIGSLKSQISRLQFQPQANRDSNVQDNLQIIKGNSPEQSSGEFQKREVKIVDCRPDSERRESFQGGAAKNSEPIRPRYGDYKPEDVSIDKFFYFGRR